MLAQSVQTCFRRKKTYTMLSLSACASIAQESYLCNVDPYPMNSFAQENNLQCYSNLCGPTLRKGITSIILVHSWLMDQFGTLVQTFLSKITYKMLRLPSWENITCRSFQPSGIYLLKVNNRNTATRCEICSKLTIKINWPRSDIFIVTFIHISQLV